jgi:hypothetical protein
MLLRFDDTPVRQASFWISLFGWLCLAAIVVLGLVLRALRARRREPQRVPAS